MFVFIIIVSCFIYGCELCGKEPASDSDGNAIVESAVFSQLWFLDFSFFFDVVCITTHSIPPFPIINMWRFWSRTNNRCVWNTTILVWYLFWSHCLHLLHWKKNWFRQIDRRRRCRRHIVKMWIVPFYLDIKTNDLWLYHCTIGRIVHDNYYNISIGSLKAVISRQLSLKLDITQFRM